jgi:hypothetical protein
MSELRVMDGRRVDRRHVLGAALFVSGMPWLAEAQARANAPIVITTHGKVQGAVCDQSAPASACLPR